MTSTSPPKTFRRVVLVRRPPGEPAESDFRVEEAATPAPGPNQVLVRVIYLSLDPYMRGRMRDAASYAAPVGLGRGHARRHRRRSRHIQSSRFQGRRYRRRPARLAGICPEQWHHLAQDRSRPGADLDGQWRARHARHDRMVRPSRDRRAQAWRDRRRLGGVRRRRPSRRPTRQARGLPRRRHCRRRRQVRLHQERTRVRRRRRLQGRQQSRGGIEDRPAPMASMSTSTTSAAP